MGRGLGPVLDRHTVPDEGQDFILHLPGALPTRLVRLADCVECQGLAAAEGGRGDPVGQDIKAEPQHFRALGSVAGLGDQHASHVEEGRDLPRHFRRVVLASLAPQGIVQGAAVPLVAHGRSVQGRGGEERAGHVLARGPAGFQGLPVCARPHGRGARLREQGLDLALNPPCCIGREEIAAQGVEPGHGFEEAHEGRLMHVGRVAAVWVGLGG